jgi:hypothetical protein
MAAAALIAALIPPPSRMHAPTTHLATSSLNVPGGLISFVVLKGATSAGHRMGLNRGVFAPFGVQENTVVQTLVSACYSIAFSGGFGTYLTAMSYQAYVNTGGAPRGTPGFNPGEGGV